MAHWQEAPLASARIDRARLLARASQALHPVEVGRVVSDLFLSKNEHTNLSVGLSCVVEKSIQNGFFML